MPAVRLSVIYDGHCELCQWSRQKLEKFDRRKNLTFIDLHDAVALNRFPQIKPDVAMKQMIAVADDGREARGYLAFVLLLEAWPHTSLLRWIMRRRMAKWIGTRIYGLIAKNRYRIPWLPVCESSCGIKQ